MKDAHRPQVRGIGRSLALQSREERLLTHFGVVGFVREPGDFVLGFGKPSYGGSVEAMPESLVGFNAFALNGGVDPEHHGQCVEQGFAGMAFDGLRNAQGDVRCPQMLKDVLPRGLLRAFVDLAGGVV